MCTIYSTYKLHIYIYCAHTVKKGFNIASNIDKKNVKLYIYIYIYIYIIGVYICICPNLLHSL